MMPPRPQWEMVDDAMAAILRQKTEGQRLAIAFDMCRFARRLICGVLRAEHPDWSAEEIRREAARRISLGAGTGRSDRQATEECAKIWG
jgi:hypothetical protein